MESIAGHGGSGEHYGEMTYVIMTTKAGTNSRCSCVREPTELGRRENKLFFKKDNRVREKGGKKEGGWSRVDQTGSGEALLYAWSTICGYI